MAVSTPRAEKPARARGFDGTGGIVSYAEDIGRHNSMDKAVGKALMLGKDLTQCYMVCTGRMAGGMVAKAYRAGTPILISNTAPFSTGIDLARQVLEGAGRHLDGPAHPHPLEGALLIFLFWRFCAGYRVPRRYHRA